MRGWSLQVQLSLYLQITLYGTVNLMHFPYQYLGIHILPIWENLRRILGFCRQLIFHHALGHGGLLLNEFLDHSAKKALAEAYTPDEKDCICEHC